jgi:hypothetical protein
LEAVASHLVAEMQANPLSADDPPGSVCAVHFPPPLIVPTAKPVPVGLEPPASQVVADPQATALSIDIPPGRVCADHLAPLLVVRTATPVNGRPL